MRSRARITGLTLNIVGLALLWERPVLAYIDPGSGSLLYQALLAAVLGLGFTFRRVLGALTRFGRPSTSTSSPAEPSSPDARDPRG